MRRADYLHLAAIVRQQREGWSAVPSLIPEQRAHAQGVADGAEGLARRFARTAHLGGLAPAEFLEACGLKP